MHCVPRDLMTQDQLADITQRLGRLGRQTNQIVLTNRHNLHGKRKLVTRRITLCIHAYELFTLLGPRRNHPGQELDEFYGSRSGLEVEIETVFDFAYIACFFVRVVFEDELFEVEKRSFVRDFLSNLDDGFPCMSGIGFCAVGTLLVGDNEFAFKCLLEDGGCECFSLDGELDSDSAGMGFGPDEAGVRQTDLDR